GSEMAEAVASGHSSFRSSRPGCILRPHFSISLGGRALQLSRCFRLPGDETGRPRGRGYNWQNGRTLDSSFPLPLTVQSLEHLVWGNRRLVKAYPDRIIDIIGNGRYNRVEWSLSSLFVHEWMFLIRKFDQQGFNFGCVQGR